MNLTPTVTLVRQLATALKVDTAFGQVAHSSYQKNWTLECGFDRRRVDWTQSSPFAVLLAGGTDIPAGRGTMTHSIGLLFGVTDSGNTPLNGSGVSETHGTAFLGENAWPAALAVIDRVLDRMPGFSLGDVSLEFSHETFPLLHLNVALTIHQTIPVGSR